MGLSRGSWLFIAASGALFVGGIFLSESRKAQEAKPLDSLYVRPGPSPLGIPLVPIPSADQVDVPGSWDEPNGRPGWGAGVTGCDPATIPASERPHRELSLKATVVDEPILRGKDLRIVLEVTNHSKKKLRLGYSSGPRIHSGALVDVRGHVVSGSEWSDVATGGRWDLEPGESAWDWHYVMTSMCGDTSRDPQPPLPVGRYHLVAWLDWYMDGHTGRWIAPPVPITLPDEVHQPPGTSTG